VDLTLEATNEAQAAAKYTLPSMLLRQRLLEQRGVAALPAPSGGIAAQRLLGAAKSVRAITAEAVRRLPAT
jgi:hypothetical protein